MYQRKYDKVYLILRPESETVRNLSGNCVLEIRNGIGQGILYAQGLWPLTGGAEYKVYMIAVQVCTRRTLQHRLSLVIVL